jgi:hypothetical protein
VVERGAGPTGSPRNEAIRTLVTAIKVVCVKSWNQDMKRELTYRLMEAGALKKLVVLSQ